MTKSVLSRLKAVLEDNGIDAKNVKTITDALNTIKENGIGGGTSENVVEIDLNEFFNREGMTNVIENGNVVGANVTRELFEADSARFANVDVVILKNTPLGIDLRLNNNIEAINSLEMSQDIRDFLGDLRCWFTLGPIVNFYLSSSVKVDNITWTLMINA